MQPQLHQARPRDVKWYHAAGLLFGDWGTSRLYVLGLAFFYSGHASPYYILAMCAILTAVAWAYTVVCKSFTDGGGVYSSAKSTHTQLALLGAFLLFADYVVTACLSAVEAFRYFGASTAVAPFLAMVAILFVAIINFVGPKHAGGLATLVAGAMLITTLVIAAFCIPELTLSHIQPDSRPIGTKWTSLVHIILALSGVEAIANMTGVMAEPVGRNSKKAIWVVLAEVVIFNILFVVALTALPSAPADILADRPPNLLTEHDLALRDTMVKVIASEYVSPAFGAVAAVVCGLLLLSAVNTAVGAMVSVQYAMARDNELPRAFLKLNIFGVPWLGLVSAMGICTLVLLFQGDVEQLAHLYAIGVVGAITINLGATCTNRKLALRKWERLFMGILALILLGVEITIAIQKVEATIFAGLVVAGGYLLRAAVKRSASITPHIPRLTAAVGKYFEAPPVAEADVLSMIGVTPFDPAKRRIIVATRGNPELLTFAAEEAENRDCNLIVLFIRDVRLIYGPGEAVEDDIKQDADALTVFGESVKLARQHKIPYLPIYCVSPSIAEMILDFTATYAADYLIMGVTRRGALFRAIRGDIITEVATNLPPETKLLIHA